MLAPYQATVRILIVNHGTARLVSQGLCSLLENSAAGAPPIHILDNSPNGDDAAYLLQFIRKAGWGATVELVRLASNEGFGAANNWILSRCAPGEAFGGCRYFFLLNPDAVLTMKTLRAAVDMIDAHPRTAALGLQLLDQDGRPTPSAFHFPTPAREFFTALSLGYDKASMEPWLIAPPPKKPAEQGDCKRTDWVSGAALLLRRDALCQVGGFDPRFFLYFEEVDWMRRARSAGWHIRTAPALTCTHLGGRSTGSRCDGRSAYHPAYFRSWGLFYRKHHGWLSGICAAMAASLGTLLRALHRSVRGKSTDIPPGYFYGVWCGMVPQLFRRTGGKP